MRIGIIALLHESNTFSTHKTQLDAFRQDVLLSGEPIRNAFVDTHHEVGGFFAALAAEDAEAVPLFAARALPSGTITSVAFESLLEQMLQSVHENMPLDGILVAPHGATVSEDFPDADGHWLSALRQQVGNAMPIIGTLDAHANLTSSMVDACDALIAYRTNPHMDQWERGVEAATLIVRSVRGEVSPVMAAASPPMAISIERQCTDEFPLKQLVDYADQQRQQSGVLSNSILLGFPYADVPEMGTAIIVVTDGDRQHAARLVAELASTLWDMRQSFRSEFISPDDALDQCERDPRRTCLLDMGDNVGGGSSADGTELLAAIESRGLGPAFGCLLDPESVAFCEQAGVGARIHLRAGGKIESGVHGPIETNATVKSLADGTFWEPQPRHGGISKFDQGPTAVCETDRGLTLMLTSRRMVPFSLQQLYGCGVDPEQFRLLVAKGVNAPLAAYREVCERFIRVNTMGSTCADMTRLNYYRRRRPMFPFEPDATFQSIE